MKKQVSISSALRNIILITIISLVTVVGFRIYEVKQQDKWSREKELLQKDFQDLAALRALSNSEDFVKLGNPYFFRLQRSKKLQLRDLRMALTHSKKMNASRRIEIVAQIERDLSFIYKLKVEEQNTFITIIGLFNLYVLVIALIASAYLITRLIKGFSQDLKLITHAYHDAGEGHLYTQVSAPNFVEWNPVVVGFNLMQKNLQKVNNRLRHKERIESLGNMAAGLAHELGNPLAGILGYAELIEEKLDDEGKKDLTKIEKKVAECRKIVDDLLLFCQGEESGQHFHEVKMSDIFNSLQVDCKREFEGQLFIHGDLNTLCIKSHGTSVKQILFNLIKNAFINGASEVHIHKAPSPAEDLRLLIEDNGPGIPIDLVNRIFEPFFTTRPTGKGTGLGLSICHGLAKQNGGYLSLTSVEKPTRFELVLPFLK